MSIFLGIMLLITGFLAVVFYNDSESKDTEIKDLVDDIGKQDEYCKKLEKKLEYVEKEKEEVETRVKQKLYKTIFQEMHYESVENLQNKLKTVLDTTTNH